MTFKRIIFSTFWRFFSFFETLYWFLKRQNQMMSFCSHGKDVFVSRGCYFSGKIFIGNDVYIGQNCRFQSTKGNIIIGNHVMFGPDVSLHSGNHRIDLKGKYMKNISFKDKRPEDDKDIIIEDDVWIGAAAIILQGVTIGQGSVIGAGSIITKTIPPYTVVVGTPSQKSWPRFNANEIAEHLNLLSECNNKNKVDY